MREEGKVIVGSNRAAVSKESKSSAFVAVGAPLAAWSASAGAIVVGAGLITDHLKTYEMELLASRWLLWIVVMALILLGAGAISWLAILRRIGFEFSEAISIVGRILWVNTAVLKGSEILRQSWLDPGRFGVIGIMLVANLVCIAVIAWRTRSVSLKDESPSTKRQYTYEDCAALALHAANLLCLFLVIHWLDLLSSWPMRILMVFGVILLVVLRVRFFTRSDVLRFVTLLLFACVALTWPAAWIVNEIRFGQYSAAESSNTPGKIVLITVDTLRADMLLDGLAGGEATMPNVMRMAEDGLIFTQATAPSSWTLPSIASMMTGLDPMTHGVDRNNRRMSAEMDTLAERLSERSYLAGAFVYNFYIHPELKADQGFEDFYFCDAKKVQMELQVLLHHLGLRRAKFEFGNDPMRESTRMAQRWLSRREREKTFLWVHYIDPHMPYAPPAEFVPAEFSDRPAAFEVRPSEWPRVWRYPEEDRQWIKALYRGEVRYVDHCIGEIIQTLKETGQYDDALIIFTSDHGEEHWDHGRFEHAHAMYQELMHVPLVIKLPRSRVKGERTMRIAVPQIYPTVLELAGVPDDAINSDYASLIPLIEGNSDSTTDTAIFSNSTLYYDELSAVIQDDLKLIHNVTANTYMLFDLKADPLESRDLASQQSEDRDRLTALLAAHVTHGKARRENLGLKTESGSEAMSEEVLRGLDDLGYLR